MQSSSPSPTHSRPSAGLRVLDLARPHDDTGDTGDTGPGGTGPSEEFAYRLYEELLRSGPSRPSQVAEAAALPADRAAAGWGYLESWGLVRPADETGFVAAVLPDAALADIAAKQSREMEHLIRARSVLTGRFQQAVPRGARVEILKGGRRRRGQLVSDLHRQTRSQSARMSPGPLPAPEMLAMSLAETAAMVERGVRVRVIHGQIAAGSARGAAYLAGLAAVGAEVRVAPHLPLDLLISDLDAAYLAAEPPEPEHTVISVRGDHLVTSFRTLFDHFWSASAPMADRGDSPPPRPEALGEPEGTILNLMARGCTDEQISRRLGLHVRTVRRHVAGIMKRLGAQTRFHAGILATQRGLIDGRARPPAVRPARAPVAAYRLPG
jgi:DNA-binding CsgD family transcriptional regulator/sugar-specific transcriptional regulator TrmB